MFRNFELFNESNSKSKNPWDYDNISDTIEDESVVEEELQKIKDSCLKGGSVDIDDDIIRLYHYTKSDDIIGDYLDPLIGNKHKHTYTGDLLISETIYFYIDKKDKEIFIDSSDLYTIDYDLKKLYPLSVDPFDYNTILSKKFKQTYYGRKDVDDLDIPYGIFIYDIIKKMKKDKFDGIINSWKKSYVVQIWKPVSII